MTIFGTTGDHRENSQHPTGVSWPLRGIISAASLASRGHAGVGVAGEGARGVAQEISDDLDVDIRLEVDDVQRHGLGG